MNSCPRCGWVRGQHGSILEGCICHWQSAQEKSKIETVPAQGTLLPKREWVGLTDEELEPLCNEWRIVFGSWTYEFAKAIEAQIKEKNT